MREILERRVTQGVSAPARGTATALALLLFAACASPPPKDHRPEIARPAPGAARSATPQAASAATPLQNDAVADASFDWHPLVVAPFGTRLVDSPIPLHGVLLLQ